MENVDKKLLFPTEFQQWFSLGEINLLSFFSKLVLKQLTIKNSSICQNHPIVPFFEESGTVFMSNEQTHQSKSMSMNALHVFTCFLSHVILKEFWFEILCEVIDNETIRDVNLRHLSNNNSVSKKIGIWRSVGGVNFYISIFYICSVISRNINLWL